MDEPVRNVTPVAVVEFCRWLTSRLGQRGVEIRIPTGLEWEYAARGTDGRTYPWGDDDVEVPPELGAGPDRLPRPRMGIGYGPFAGRDVAKEDESPFKVVAMGTNVAEWTLQVPPVDDYGVLYEPDAGEDRFTLSVSNLRRWIQSPQAVARRGASYSDDVPGARRNAKPWNSTGTGPRDNFKNVGVRLVKVRTPG
jgi:formylglycine-generating enzyme required for sulfatase activity